jgi:RND family efflux transporter MFP subunit
MKPHKIPTKPLEELDFDKQEQASATNQGQSNKVKLSRWLLSVLILTGGIAAWQFLTPSPVPKAQTAKSSTSAPARPVVTKILTDEKANKKVKLLGQVEAGEKATLSPQIDGTVKRISVKEGDRIREGMVVAILDDADVKLALMEAKAKLAQAQSNLDRLQVGTRSEVIEQRQAELKSAQAREQEAEANLNSLIALQPDLIAQRRAELESAQTKEKEAQDNLERIRSLSQEGAISERVLVEAQSSLDTAVSERLRTQSALKAQETTSRQEIAEARTNLDNIRNERLRIQAMLAEAQAGPTLEEIEAQKGLVNIAQANVQKAELALQRTEIKAPFSGIIQSREADAGDYVEINDSLFTLVSDRSLDIFLEIPEKLSGQVSRGMSVNLFARAIPDWQRQTMITAVIPAADSTSRRQLVRVTLDNPPSELLPGMAIQADLEIPVNSADGFMIPRDALTRRGNKWLLFTVKDNQAQQLEVEIVSDLGAEVVVSNPQLRKGQSVVIKGGDGLRPNSPVKIVSK